MRSQRMRRDARTSRSRASALKSPNISGAAMRRPGESGAAFAAGIAHPHADRVARCVAHGPAVAQADTRAGLPRDAAAGREASPVPSSPGRGTSNKASSVSQAAPVPIGVGPRASAGFVPASDRELVEARRGCRPRRRARCAARLAYNAGDVPEIAFGAAEDQREAVVVGGARERASCRRCAARRRTARRRRS